MTGAALTGTSDAGEASNNLAEGREVLPAPTGSTRCTQELADDPQREQWALLLGRVCDGEVEVLGHQVGHEPRLPVVGRRAVCEHALEGDAGPNRGAVTRRVADYLVQLVQVDARLRRHRRCLRSGEHLCSVNEVVAALYTWAAAGPADMDDEPGERLQGRAGRVEHVGLAPGHERESAFFRPHRAARERRLEVAGAGPRHALVKRTLRLRVDSRR